MIKKLRMIGSGALLFSLLAVGVYADEAEQGGSTGEVANSIQLRDLNIRLMGKLSDSLGEVKYYLAPDEKGERNELSFGYICPGCGGMHYNSATTLLEDRKPLKAPVFAIAEDEFIASDSGVIPEYLDRMVLVFKDQEYPAEIVEYYPDRESVRIKTEKPVPGMVPLKFQPDIKGKKYEFFRADEDGMIQVGVRPYNDAQVYRDLGTGNDFLKMTPNVLIVNEEGDVAALSMNSKMKIGEEPFVPPTQWKGILTKDYVRNIQDFSEKIKSQLYPVKILLEQLRKKPDMYSSREASQNEFEGMGLRLDDGRILVNIAMSPADTGRLKKITITADGKEVPARFVGSLKNFGGLVIKPEEELKGKGAGVVLYDGKMNALLDAEVYAVNVKHYGKTVEVKAVPSKINSFDEGFKGMLIPDARSAGNNMLLFLHDGSLVAYPIERRSPGERDNYRYRSGNPVSSALLLEELANFDRLNVPRNGKMEYAWMGIDAQGLTPDLARAKDASELTDNGDSGIMVSYVYPGSPAEKIGLQLGDIILSITPADSANKIKMERYRLNLHDERDFPWAQYDQIPAQYYDQIPAPWGTTQSGINGLLTDIGIGAEVKVQIFRDGKLENLDMTIGQQPESFETTKRYQFTALGLTVSNLTYEVRNYFQLKPEDSGIIISSVRAGGRAAVAGIKPYEIIVSINGEPVKNIQEFQTMIKGQEELKIGVRRLDVTRIVTVKLEKKKTADSAEADQQSE